METCTIQLKLFEKRAKMYPTDADLLPNQYFES